jgi:hypothetical protein
LKNIEKRLVLEAIQVIDKREVPARGTRCFALDLVCKLKGIYVPKQINFDPESPLRKALKLEKLD